MLTMRDHDVEDYAALRDMDATDVGDLHEDDRACLEELGQYLVATDAWQRFAIWLLHKHFEPGPGEVFIESVDAATRRIETGPADRSAYCEQELQPTAVRFDASDGPGVNIVGMEFAAPDDFGSVSPLDADDEAVLSGIADRLRSHGKSDRFGVRLLRGQLPVTDEELLLETCDKVDRKLICDIGDREKLRNQIIETAWQWKPVAGEAGQTVMQKCYFACEPWTDGEHTRTGCRT